MTPSITHSEFIEQFKASVEDPIALLARRLVAAGWTEAVLRSSLEDKSLRCVPYPFCVQLMNEFRSASFEAKQK